MQVKVISTVSLDKSVPAVPVRVIRARKPRRGGVTLAVLSNLDGLGVARAAAFVRAAGHVIV